MSKENYEPWWFLAPHNQVFVQWRKLLHKSSMNFFMGKGRPLWGMLVYFARTSCDSDLPNFPCKYFSFKRK